MYSRTSVVRGGTSTARGSCLITMPSRSTSTTKTLKHITKLGARALQQRALWCQKLSEYPHQVDDLGVVERDRDSVLVTFALDEALAIKPELQLPRLRR